jgi:hypothetical protein
VGDGFIFRTQRLEAAGKAVSSETKPRSTPGCADNVAYREVVTKPHSKSPCTRRSRDERAITWSLTHQRSLGLLTISRRTAPARFASLDIRKASAINRRHVRQPITELNVINKRFPRNSKGFKFHRVRNRIHERQKGFEVLRVTAEIIIKIRCRKTSLRDNAELMLYRLPVFSCETHGQRPVANEPF